MFITLPDAVLHVIRRLNTAGYEAYAVGGCVRDSLMGKAPEDWDITTSATPEEMQAIFREYRCLEIGLQHGTLTVIVEDMPLEITTYRVDGAYSDGRHPDSVVFTRSLAEDLRRRDFTINAMAYHPTDGLVDFYGGQKDIQDRIIRCVGEAKQRFGEDALRILRALRFASVLGFSLDSDTASALCKLSPTLSRVASERIVVELQKLLCGQDAQRIVSAYTDVLERILPEIVGLSDTVLSSNVPAVPHTRFAALFWQCNCAAEDAKSALRRLRVDTHTINRVTRLLTCRDWPLVSDAELLHLLNQLDQELIFDYLALRSANESVRRRVHALLDGHRCYKISMLDINGNDVMAVGVHAGPQIGRILQELLDAVINGDCPNTKEALLNHITQTQKPVR